MDHSQIVRKFFTASICIFHSFYAINPIFHGPGVRYTFSATSEFPPLGIQKVQSQSLNNYVQKKFVNTGKQQSSKKVNSGLLLLFLLRYKQFTDINRLAQEV